MHPLAKPLGRAAALVACSVFTFAACGSDTPPPADSAEAVAVAPRVIDVSAGDYFYTMADTISAGATTFQLTTTGQEPHHMQIVRLNEGKALPDLLAAMASHGPPPAWAEFVGGPNAPSPNASASIVTLDLAPGTYGVLCVIPSPDGVPHLAKGMSKTLVVTPATGGALPAVTNRMTLTDYDFVFAEPLTAGTHVLEVKNAAAQPHEVLLVKLVPGATPIQFVEWTEKPAGPPPGELIGGTVGLSQGMANLVHLDLAAGEYALICFIPDAGDGRPHFLHGMIQQISVQ